jgi:hypothetical protein
VGSSHRGETDEEGSVNRASLFMGALQGKPGGGLLSPRILIEMKKALYTGHLSLWELCKGNLEVGSSHR